MKLLLFTASYPYDSGAEQTFLNVEIQYLQDAFEKVILVPRKSKGRQLDIPERVEVDESYSVYLNNANKIQIAMRVLTSGLLYKEIFSHPKLLLYPSALKRLVTFLAGAYLTRSWVTKWLEKNGEGEYLFYTYWFDQAAMGIGLVKQQGLHFQLVSRTHAYDLYDETFRFPYWPCRSLALSLLDALFPDSEAGTMYLKKRYPKYSAKYETALLGINDLGVTSCASTDGCFRIFSCSFLVEVKRVDLLLDGILRAAFLRPEQKFEWHHIGNGEQWSRIMKRISNELPANVKAYFPGYLSPNDLYAYYKNNPVDVFVNVSSSEGTPVSLMEAASCGMPIVATSIGGNTEVVSDKNGLLLSENPTPDEIAKALFELIDNPEKLTLMRQGSREIWKNKYNADENFKAFAKRLKKQLG